MYGDSSNTSNLMLPILLDMANLIRRAVRSGKESREVREAPPQAQLLRRSDDDDITYLDDEPFEVAPKEIKTTTTTTTTTTTSKTPLRNKRVRPQRQTTAKPTVKTTVKPSIRSTTTRKPTTTPKEKTTDKPVKEEVQKTINKTESRSTPTEDVDDVDDYIAEAFDDDELDAFENIVEDDKNKSKLSVTTPESSTTTMTKGMTDNSTLDLAAESTNQTLAQDIPVAEKLRAFNRFIDRKGSNLIRRGTFSPKPAPRRTTSEPALNPISRRRPAPARKLPVTEQAKCELFTNTVCLHAEDYPADAIVQSIRRNKAAAGALLADMKDPGDGALDGVTAAQEAKYTADHYLTSNRRGDTANRDFASAGEAGFMCPSTVKYARPQRARATSGQWKYIVNTGEHTQTLRLEKCLKPKESCTYLTDNFKSKCVQVYNYHRLLTWDQQNGLHMDIFKVPTCCSCHIEGYSVSFPPLGHRVHESSSETFPGEDLSAEHGNGAFEQVQSSVHRPTKTPSFLKKPLELYPPFSDNHNLIGGGSPFMSAKTNDDESAPNLGNLPLSNSMDSYGNNYFPDSYNQASSVRNVKRPLERPSRNPSGQVNLDQGSLPSYLEPPTVSAPSFSFAKDSKYKLNNNHLKRGASRPHRRPIRKKIGGPDDMMPSGTAAVENMESLEDFNNEPDDIDDIKPNVNIVPKRNTIAPKLHTVTSTEKIVTVKSRENHNVNANAKKINYDYHPIIEFFTDEGRDENESIDREDVQSFISPESEWKPINHPPSRNVQTTHLVGRRKH